jgi:hypothetical protein
MASNSGNCSASALKSSLNGGSHSTVPFLPTLPYRINSIASIVLLITSLHGPSRKHRFQQYLYRCMSVRCRGNVFTEPLPINGSTRYNIYSSGHQDALWTSIRKVVSSNLNRDMRVFVDFLSPSRQIPVEYFDYVTTASFQILYNSSLIPPSDAM